MEEATTGNNDGLLEMWLTHCAINHMLLGTISDEALGAVPLLKGGKPGRGRDIARVFMHMYGARYYHFESLGKDYIKGLHKPERGATGTRDEIAGLLEATDQAVVDFVRSALESGKLVRKHHPALFLGYLISHESHHRGQMLLALKQNGFTPTEEQKWGIWGRWFKD